MPTPARYTLLFAVLALSCDAPPPQQAPIEAPSFRAVPAPLPMAYCTAVVEGKGNRDTETDYIPHVIQCENGGANLEALKAQAIAARSVLYYNMATKGSICDSQGCQVYSCGASPQPIHYQAAAETAGQYLSFADTLTYGFYVDGDHTPDPGTCKGMAGQSNEKYITYNDGKTGNNVQQTSLGYVGPPGFGQNRGCMAQWGARCLENTKGKNHLDILRFYYGADIQLLTAPGACGGCEPGCDGSKIVGADCSEGDCAAYGANCVDDELGPHCVFFACPPQGQAKVCVDDKTIGDCNDGQISTGDCSMFAAYCSTKVGDEARCVSVFCAEPGDTPVPHDGCFIDGQPFHCDELGGLSTDMKCPDGQKCTVYPTFGCSASLGCPATGEGAVCMDASVVGHCYEGGVHKTTDCSLQEGACVVLGDSAACFPGVCVDQPGVAPGDHDVCLADGSVGHCFADGTLTTTACPPGLVCMQSGEQAFCGEPDDASTGPADDTGPPATSAATDDTGAPTDPTPPTTTATDPTTTATTAADDTSDADDDAGCGCTTTTPRSAGPFVLLLAAMGLRRRRLFAQEPRR